MAVDSTGEEWASVQRGAMRNSNVVVVCRREKWRWRWRRTYFFLLNQGNVLHFRVDVAGFGGTKTALVRVDGCISSLKAVNIAVFPSHLTLSKI